MTAAALVLGLLPVLTEFSPAAAAEHYTDREAACERMATTTEKRTVANFQTMAIDCSVSAARHKERADETIGPKRQQELGLRRRG